ncbi:RNA polymerase sigma-70 factor (ECF subfamily) [Pedobacter sp. AK017]|uniref:RNA polymerase sigma-70 factor n=1 Tax=Pedobacter sp. AK017 TaxID=2723073 RepID=UPI001612D97B|nr:RNA polymerase sigma-70 factor [Pedobacter sp. AK017]MBB5441275.1 RNA polymerase sigma-70 factor (ECF subfamily) [Pedobacter sp. AK017]
MNNSQAYQNSKALYHADADLLVREFNAHHQFAFRFIFESYFRAAVMFAEGILIGQVQEAEDIVQDTFIKLWNRNDTFRAQPAIKSFIYTSVKNACLDKLRRNQIADKYEAHAAHQQQLLESGFIEPLITAETTKLINDAIEALPEQGRNVFKMSLGGLKNDEIAERLDISVNTVKTHKQRALASLRLSLGDAMLILLLLYHNHLIK